MLKQMLLPEAMKQLSLRDVGLCWYSLLISVTFCFDWKFWFEMKRFQMHTNLCSLYILPNHYKMGIDGFQINVHPYNFKGFGIHNFKFIFKSFSPKCNLNVCLSWSYSRNWWSLSVGHSKSFIILVTDKHFFGVYVCVCVLQVVPPRLQNMHILGRWRMVLLMVISVHCIKRMNSPNSVAFIEVKSLVGCNLKFGANNTIT